MLDPHGNVPPIEDVGYGLAGGPTNVVNLSRFSVRKDCDWVAWSPSGGNQVLFYLPIWRGRCRSDKAKTPATRCGLDAPDHDIEVTFLIFRSAANLRTVQKQVGGSDLP